MKSLLTLFVLLLLATAAMRPIHAPATAMAQTPRPTAWSLRWQVEPAYISSGTLTTPRTGSTVVLTATPALGSKFGNWSGCDSVSGNQCTKTVTADVAVTAQFDPKEPEVVQHGAAKVWGSAVLR
jgi:hypothetical protein